MKRISIICVTLLVLIACTCQAANLTGSHNYGVTVDAGVFEFRAGSMLDYEVLPNLYLTLDIQTRYSWVSKPLSRYELSLNWYPDMWLFRGWCVSAGTAVRTEAGPQVFVEVSTPWSMSIPKWLRFWER